MDMNFNSGKVFCTKCGAANKAGYRFCVKCGTKLVTPVREPQAEDEPDIPKVEPAKVEPQPEADIQRIRAGSAGGEPGEGRAGAGADTSARSSRQPRRRSR